MSQYIQFPASGGSGGVQTYATAGDLPAGVDDGTLAVTLDTHYLYEYNAGTLTWVAIAGPAFSGNVIGPASATDEAIARFDGTTGKLIKNSAATLSNAGLLSTADVTVTNMTAKSVLFAGTGGAVTQDNTNFTYDTSIDQLSLGPTASTGNYRMIMEPASDSFGYGLALEGTGAGSSRTWEFFPAASGFLYFRNPGASTAPLTFDNVGRVGVETQSPAAALHIKNEASRTGDPTLRSTAVAGQTGDLFQAYSAAEAVKLASIDVSGNIAATNLSGTNTGDVTLTAVGAVPNANGASLSGQALTLQPADGTNPGVLTAAAQTIGGTKTFANIINSGLTASQAVVTDGSKQLASLAYDSANTASALVQRDGSGNFAAGTITATLTGTASGNTTITPTNHGVVISGAANAMTAIAGTTGTILQGVTGSDPAFSATPTLGLAASATGKLNLSGTTSGTVTVQPQDAAGTYNFNLPTSAGSAGQPLLSGGGGATAQTYGTLSVGGGGTGATTLTSHGVLLGNGTGAIAALAEAAAGTLLGGVASSNPAFTATPTLGIAGSVKGTLALAGNTSGTVTVQPAAAAGTWTLTLPTTGGTNNYFLQTDGNGTTTWAAASASAFTGARVYANTTTSLTANTYTDMSFTTEDYDVGGNMSSSQFTAPSTGYYQVNASVLLTGSMTATDQFNMRILVNGSEKASWRWDAISTTTYVVNAKVSDTLLVTSGHVVKVQVRVQGVGSQAVVNDSFCNYFSIWLAGT